MNGEQLHRIRLKRQRQFDGAALQGTHKVVGRGIARTVQAERQTQQRIHRIQGRSATFRRQSGSGAFAEFTFADDAIQQVVRRQMSRSVTPALQQVLRPSQRIAHAVQ